VSNEKKPTLLPAPIGAALARTRAWWTALSRPARVLLLSTSVIGAALSGYFLYAQSHETYAVLFSQLEQEDAAAVAAKLKELKTPYRVEGGGTTITVPESHVGEMRLELASAGMPRGGGVGFESFDKMRLGATEFEQRVLYRRALEGELARTIGSVSAIQSARVHLVMPEKSVFVTRAEPASASIVVRLRPGRSVGQGEISGIVHLTAASVPGLTADRIALVTTEGTMLKRPRVGADGATPEGDEEQGLRQRAVEAQLEERARSMLEKVVGQGHVDVRVTAEVDSARVEHSEDHYDPSRTALRSEESSTEHTPGSPDDSVGGVPGAESNLSATTTPKGADAGAPKPIAAAAGKGVEQPSRESHTRNYEVDHVSDKRVTGPGTLKRIAVAVVLDGVPVDENGTKTTKPRDRAELDKLAALVRSAVGANEARGDVVTVDSVPFDTESKDAPATVPTTPAPAAPKRWRAYIPAGAGAGALLFAFTVYSIVARRRRAKEPVAQILPPTPVTRAIEAPVDVRAAALERAARDPATAALVLRAWLGSGNDVVPSKA
jgi:flagellar M-ring protein FliF